MLGFNWDEDFNDSQQQPQQKNPDKEQLSPYQQKAKQHIENMFEMYDINHWGYLRQDEYQKFFADVYASLSLLPPKNFDVFAKEATKMDDEYIGIVRKNKLFQLFKNVTKI